MAGNVFELNVNINSTINSEAQNALNEVSNGSLPDIQLSDGSWMSGEDYQKSIEGMEEQMLNSEKLKSTGKAAGKALLAAGAINLAVTGMNWAHSRVSTIYKDQARANDISNKMSVVSETGNLVSAGVTGFAAGGAVGATIGVALSLATSALKIAQRVEAYQDKQKDYADESDYAMERLGLLTAGKGR